MKIVAFALVLAVVIAVASADMSITSVKGATAGIRNNLGAGNTVMCGATGNTAIAAMRVNITAGQSNTVIGSTTNAGVVTAYALTGSAPVFSAANSGMQLANKTVTTGTFTMNFVVPTTVANGDATVQAVHVPTSGTTTYQCVDASISGGSSTSSSSGSTSAAAFTAPTSVVAVVVAFVAVVAALL